MGTGGTGGHRGHRRAQGAQGGTGGHRGTPGAQLRLCAVVTGVPAHTCFAPSLAVEARLRSTFTYLSGLPTEHVLLL